MSRMILMGDEAVAQAALDAGICGAFAYPGTPSTELFEYIEAKGGAYARWSTNEKVAMEEAIGVSYAGRRAIVSMKHVGLNVAADPFLNVAVTGAHGAMVVCVADDPGMHSSQNEQDTRYLAAFARVPCLEPSTQQEAYDMTRAAFELSERIRLPVLVRLVTRLAHSRAGVETAPPSTPLPLGVATDPRRYILLPVNARRNWAELVARWDQVEASLWDLGLNHLELRGQRLGVVTAGVGHNYFMENLDPSSDISWLKVGTYPAPVPLLARLVEHCDRILVVEDGYPFLEEALKGVLRSPMKPVSGRLDGSLPRTGELDPASVRKALGLPALPAASPELMDLAGRPPALCKGCPHADTFLAINEVLADHSGGRVLSDIGCYTLGALPPYKAIHSCVDMGASVSMAIGASIAGVRPALAVIGDSTFAHSGITPFLDAVNHNVDMVLVILDNSIVAMTGRQETALSGDRLVAFIKGMGVDPAHVRLIRPHPKNHAENVAILREEVAWAGPSVIIAQRPCIQIRK